MKNFAIISTVLLSVATIGTEAGHEHEPEPEANCRDTVVPGDFTNDTVLKEAMRKVVMDYWNSEALPKDLSPDANLLIEKVLAGNETDSLSKLSTMYYFTISSSIFFPLAEDNPGLCFLAMNANASATWADCGDGRLALKNIKVGILNRFSWCMNTITTSLERNGCKKLPTVNVRSQSNCYAKGRVWEIEKSLEYYGKDLPCSFVDLIYRLYYSENYYDNLLAATFVSTLNELSDDIISLYHADIQIEVVNSVADPKDKICCCKKRRERFTYLCNHIDNTELEPAIQKYANTECPPGAAYLK